MIWFPSLRSCSQSRYLSSPMRGMKLSAGIQLLPPQNAGTPFISKKKLVPGWSFNSLSTTLTLLIPIFLLTRSISLPSESSSVAVNVYSGCAPYPWGYHNSGLSKDKVQTVSSLVDAVEVEQATLPDEDLRV